MSVKSMGIDRWGDVTTDSAFDKDLIYLFDNSSYFFENDYEASCQWLENNGYSRRDDSDYPISIIDKENILLISSAWSNEIDIYKSGIYYRDSCTPPMPWDDEYDEEVGHKRYVELYETCQEQWDIILEADQANKCESENKKHEVSLFGGKDDCIYILQRNGYTVTLDAYGKGNSSWLDTIDVMGISIPWDLITSVDLSSVENLHAWARANEYGVDDSSSEDDIKGYIFKPKDSEYGDIRLRYNNYLEDENDKGVNLAIASYEGTNSGDIVKQVLSLLENGCDDKIRASDEPAFAQLVCEYGDKDIYISIDAGRCELIIKEKHDGMN